MFIFAKQYKTSIFFDYSRKANDKYIKQQKGEFLKLSFSNTEIKKQQKTKLKHLLVLELLCLQKAFFFFELNKNKRKQNFVPKLTSIYLTGKFLDYFLFSFLKLYVGNIKNLLYFFSEPKQKLDIDLFDLLFLNKLYFNDIKQIKYEYCNITKKISYEIKKPILLSFYKLNL
jgi:hypothetical protein